MPTPILTKNKYGVYEARWSEDRRTRCKSMGTADRHAAEARFAQWLLVGGHNAHKGEAAPDAAELTIDELWGTYERLHINRNVVAKGTAEYSWKNLSVVFGTLTPKAINQDVVDGYVDRRLAGTVGRKSKLTTIRRELVALIACLNWCAKPKGQDKQGLIAKTDVPQIELPPEGDPKDRWLSTTEIDKMLSAALDMRVGQKLSRGERFLWLALQTAARKQAILDLTWDRVDFEIGMIHYNVPGRKKTKKRRVSAPISKTLMPILQRAYKERENDLVMTTKAAVWSTVQSIAVKAGLAERGQKAVDGKPKATGVSPHTLRHTAATHMARRGVPLYTIAGVLGNTLAMTEKVYAKHCPAALRDAVNMIPGNMEPPRNNRRTLSRTCAQNRH